MELPSYFVIFKRRTIHNIQTQKLHRQVKILLLGPTAVGKTELSLRLAEELGGEIISADSRQCYKYMNIGTATPSDEELERVRHYNISIIDPSVKDSAADYYERATEWEQDITSRGKAALFVGGSTLHQQCIIRPLDDIPEADEENISELERQMEVEGVGALYARLQEVDPEYARNMDGMNPQRIVRALDVWMQTGEAFSSFHSGTDSISPSANTFVIGLKRNRKQLYDRINRRVDAMFESGFLDEVRTILDMGYTLDDPGLNTVGYKEAIAFLNNEMTQEEMVREMKTQTRRYAKRQLTWFRRWDFIKWFDLDKWTAEQAQEKILQYLAAKSNKD